jgi:hypothetical protein
MEVHPHRLIFFRERPIAKLLAGGRKLLCQTAAHEWNGRGASYFWQPLSSTSKHSAVFLAPLANSTCAHDEQRERRRRAKYEQKVDKETVPASQ